MPKLEVLTSAANPLLKDIRRAVARGARTSEGYCVAETFHLLEEALRSDCAVHAVIAAESVAATVEAHIKRLSGVRLVVVADSLFHGISGTETAQGVMALTQPPEWKIDQLFRGRPLVVVLDGIQDPGNAGAILRAAEAFGATGVLFLKGTASPYNPKAVRASAGSLYRMPLVAGVDATLARAALDQRRLDVYAAMPSGSRNLADADLTRKCAFIIGSEGRGVSDAWRAGTVPLGIPVSGVESMNASIATAVLLYEARRQRMRA